MLAGVDKVWRRTDGCAARRWTQLTLLLALATLAAASSRYYPHPDKRNEQMRPFVLGSRYGRSGDGTDGGAGEPPSPPLAVAPRNDRFFMGSRYGKRSATAAAVERRGRDVEAGGAAGGGEGGEEGADALACRYTGLYQLYRCRAPPPPPAARTPTRALRSNDASNLSDEILADDFKDLD